MLDIYEQDLKNVINKNFNLRNRFYIYKQSKTYLVLDEIRKFYFFQNYFFLKQIPKEYWQNQNNTIEIKTCFKVLLFSLKCYSLHDESLLKTFNQRKERFSIENNIEQQAFINIEQLKRFEHKLLIFEQLIYFLKSVDLIKMIENNSLEINQIESLYEENSAISKTFQIQKCFFPEKILLKSQYDSSNKGISLFYNRILIKVLIQTQKKMEKITKHIDYQGQISQEEDILDFQNY